MTSNPPSKIKSFTAIGLLNDSLKSANKSGVFCLLCVKLLNQADVCSSLVTIEYYHDKKTPAP